MAPVVATQTEKLLNKLQEFFCKKIHKIKFFYIDERLKVVYTNRDRKQVRGKENGKG